MPEAATASAASGSLRCPRPRKCGRAIHSELRERFRIRAVDHQLKLSGRDERVPQRVRADLLGDPGAAGDPADDAGCAVPVHPPPVADQEHRYPAGPHSPPGRAGQDRAEARIPLRRLAAFAVGNHWFGG
jgi:hypothetical protein